MIWKACPSLYYPDEGLTILSLLAAYLKYMLHGIRYITTKNAGDWWKKKLLRDIMIEGSTELHIPPTVAPDGQTGRER